MAFSSSNITCNIPLNLSIGDTFESFKEAVKKIKQETEKNFVQYYRRDSRTIEAAKKKTKRFLNPELRFYQMKYACIHGGRSHVPSGKGLRNKRTFRNEVICPACIVLRIDNDGNKLSVIKIDNTHNHKVVQTLFNELPQQRKLPPELRESAKKLLSVKANKHLIREQLEQESQKHIKLKDLSNLQQENKRHYQNNIEVVCKHINEKIGADCHLLIEDEYFRGLIFCTPSMMSNMQAFPEMICIDASYRLLNIRAPVYIILIEDGCGESEIVAVGILTREDKASVNWLLSKFKELNPSWVDTKNVMADKDWTEREVLRECFPNAKILICIFHAFKIFNREITSEKLKISSIQRTKALQILQDMVYATSQNSFDELKGRIERELPKSINEYFNKNWLNICEEWCPRIGTKILNFMNTTNNRVEGINAKLKSIISLNSSLEEFFEHLLVTIKSLEKEKNSRLAYNLNKRNINNFSRESPEYKYLKLVSDYAFQKFLTQLKYIDKVNFVLEEDMNIYKVFSTASKNEMYNTTSNSCECYFFTSMGLPCKHIFAIRQHMHVDLFDTKLVNQRWTLEYILKHKNVFNNSNILDPNAEPKTIPRTNNIEVITVKDLPKILSQQEKYKCAATKGKSIAYLAAEASTKDFKKIISALDDFISLLEHNKFDFQIISSDTIEEITVDNQNIEYSMVETENSNEFENNIFYEVAHDEQNCKVVDTENMDNTEAIAVEKQNIESCIVETINYDQNETKSFHEVEHDQNFKVVDTIDFDREYNKRFEIQLISAGNNQNIENSMEETVDEEQSNISKNTECDDVSNKDCDVSNKASSDMNQNEFEDVCNNENFTENDIVLANIKVPPVYRKRGRPSGCNLTAIGLPSRRKKHLPFKQLSKQKRIDTILEWILNSPSEITNRKIKETDLKHRDTIDVRITEVSLLLIKQYFDEGIFEIVKNYRTWLSKNGVWVCPCCNTLISDLPSIRCDACLQWLHIHCVNDKNVVKNVSTFICRKCNGE